MAYRKGWKTGGKGKTKLPVDEDGPRYVPGQIGRTGGATVVQGRTGYTLSKKSGPGKHGTKNITPTAGP